VGAACYCTLGPVWDGCGGHIGHIGDECSRFCWSCRRHAMEIPRLGCAMYPLDMGARSVYIHTPGGTGGFNAADGLSNLPSGAFNPPRDTLLPCLSPRTPPISLMGPPTASKPSSRLTPTGVSCFPYPIEGVVLGMGGA
jgi:hypothetical protein